MHYRQLNAIAAFDRKKKVHGHSINPPFFYRHLNLCSLITFTLKSSEFTNNDFLRLWKGLYYCMWMSDKPLVQEELTEELGSLIHCFPDVKVGVQFFRNFLETMCLEWFGIDQWRLDKFMMVSSEILELTLKSDVSILKSRGIFLFSYQKLFSLVGAPRNSTNDFRTQEL